MNTVVIGQGWFGEQAFRMCHDTYKVLAVFAPKSSDRLFKAAQGEGIASHVNGRRISGDDIPEGTDVIVCAHAHAFIEASARIKTTYGAIGYHPSLLPRHRGRDAVRWTIRMNDPIAGGTVYWMDDGADTGAIAAQAFCHVRRDDDAMSLWRRDLAPIGLSLLESVLRDVSEGKVRAEPQLECVATWEPSLKPTRLSVTK